MGTKASDGEKTDIPGIYKHEDHYAVLASAIDPKTSKRKYREGRAPTLEAAVLMRDQLRDQLRSGEAVEKRSRPRLHDFAAKWFELHAPRIAPSTRARYENELTRINDWLPDFWVDAIRREDIANAINKALAGGEKPPTINSRLRTLRLMLDLAVEEKLLAGNPARAVSAFTERRTRGKRGTAYTADQFRRFLVTLDAFMQRKGRGAVSPDVGRLIQLAAWTGMRRGELLAIKWSAWLDGELHVEWSVWGREEKVTKTDDPRRVPVVGPLAEALTAQRQWLVATQHPGLASGLMFPASARGARSGLTRMRIDAEKAGRPQDAPTEVSWYRAASIFDKSLARVCLAAELPPVSPHSFRRTFEDLLRLANVDDLVRRSLAGWRTDQAQGIYATVRREERDAGLAEVVKLVSR